MLCHGIAQHEMEKCETNPFIAPRQRTFHPIIMNIQASPPHLKRTHLLDVASENKIRDTNPSFRTLNSNLDCIFIQIESFRRCAIPHDLS
jgi:hypothetical protein